MDEFAQQIGCERGVSGYIYRTVPIAIHAWLSYPHDYRTAISEVIRCGGDTDTTAAIVGAIVGSGVGRTGIPPEWVNGMWEWPRTVSWMERLAKCVEDAVTSGQGGKVPGTLPGIGLVRNALFASVVMCHVVRRMLPPY